MNRGEIVSRLTRAIEALADGDTEFAARIVEGLRRDLEARPYRYRCGRCARRFRWPGELDHHLATSSCGLVEVRSRSAA